MDIRILNACYLRITDYVNAQIKANYPLSVNPRGINRI